MGAMTDAERILEQTVDVHVPQAMEGIEIMAPALAAARKRRRAKVAPTLAVAYAAPIPVIGSVTSFCDQVRVILTCRCPCSASSRDRVYGILTCRCPCTCCLISLAKTLAMLALP